MVLFSRIFVGVCGGTAAEVITTMPFTVSAADVFHKFEGSLVMYFQGRQP